MRINKRENICIIPARGGSKRIPRKNLKSFFGKPIIYYVIKNIKDTNFFDKIVVSTDDLKIAQFSKKNGAYIHVRQKNLAKDNVPLIDVIAKVIKDLEKKNLYYKKICCLFPTSIFLKKSQLKLGFKKLKPKLNYVFTAKKYDHPIERSFKKKRNTLVMTKLKTEKKNTQFFTPSYHDAAQFYLGWKRSWISKKKIFQGKSDFIEIPKLNSQDIDTYDDWQISEILWKLGKRK